MIADLRIGWIISASNQWIIIDSLDHLSVDGTAHTCRWPDDDAMNK
jgi:hypothetical protein